MSANHLDPASFAWGLAKGVAFGSCLRGTLDALFLQARRMVRPGGNYGLPSDHDWRRSFNHENTNRPSGPPPLKLRRSEPEELFIRMDEGRTIRGNGNGGPTTPKPDITPKPQPAGGHLIIEGRLFGGYQPRPQQGTPNPPPSEP
jgi:hypothetical protein